VFVIVVNFVKGATNRPQDIDEAARRRLVERIYIPLPSPEARFQLIKNLIKKDSKVKMLKKDIQQVVEWTSGYSCSDLTSLCKDAAMEPIRELGMSVASIPADQLRPVTVQDFRQAVEHIRPSVSKESLKMFEQWNSEFGSS